MIYRRRMEEEDYLSMAFLQLHYRTLVGLVYDSSEYHRDSDTEMMMMMTCSILLRHWELRAPQARDRFPIYVLTISLLHLLDFVLVLESKANGPVFSRDTNCFRCLAISWRRDK